MATSNESIAIARSWLGYKEGDNNDTIFGKEFGLNFVAWCVEFVSSVYKSAGLKAGSDYPSTASSGEAVSWYKNNNKFNLAASGYQPQAGDSIFFWDGSKVYHTGLVESVADGVITTIEGNSGAGSDSVVENNYKTTDTKIYGYGSPQYTGTSSGGSPSSAGAPSIWGWIQGKNGFLDGATGRTEDQRKAGITLAVMVIGGVVLVLMSIGFIFGDDIIAIAAPEAGAAMKAAQAAKE